MLSRAVGVLRDWKAAASNRVSAVHQSLAFHLENPSLVVLFLLLCYLDVLLGSWSLSDSINPSATIARTRDIILYAQACELVLQLITFHTRFFGHWGYAFDSLLVVTRFLNKHSITAVDEEQLVLLSFLRVWRFVQVVTSYVDVEISKHNRTKKAADAWKMELERETKQNREEVETLREALRLAALDAAAAMSGQKSVVTGRVSPTETARAAPADILVGDGLTGGD